jgi:hypothetical protein
MAVLATSGLSAIPNNIATGIWQKATTGSTVGQLSGSEPQKFGSTNVMTLTGLPRAEYVAEGAQKGSSSATFGTKTITPHKAQVTIRANEEVKWADEDYQLDVLNELGIALGGALARALDLGVYHAINPLTGTAAASITSKITDTTKSVEVAGSADTEVEAAAGLVIAAGFTPSGYRARPEVRVDPRDGPLLRRPEEVPGPRLRDEHHHVRGPQRVRVDHRQRDAGGDGHHRPRHHRRLLHHPVGCAAVDPGADDRVRRPRRSGRPEAQQPDRVARGGRLRVGVHGPERVREARRRGLIHPDLIDGGT